MRAAADRAEAWLAGHADSVSPQALARAVLSHYGSDRTFSAPILTLAALAGRLGPADGAWQLVPQLPFELALFPPRLFKWLGLPVVSYALPALIAIGQVRHRLAPTRNPLRRAIRNLAARRTLGLLQRMQPANGGFLEATPLTGFVVLSLAACGRLTQTWLFGLPRWQSRRSPCKPPRTAISPRPGRSALRKSAHGCWRNNT